MDKANFLTNALVEDFRVSIWPGLSAWATGKFPMYELECGVAHVGGNIVIVNSRNMKFEVFMSKTKLSGDIENPSADHLYAQEKGYFADVDPQVAIMCAALTGIVSDLAVKIMYSSEGVIIDRSKMFDRFASGSSSAGMPNRVELLIAESEKIPPAPEKLQQYDNLEIIPEEGIPVSFLCGPDEFLEGVVYAVTNKKAVVAVPSPGGTHIKYQVPFSNLYTVIAPTPATASLMEKIVDELDEAKDAQDDWFVDDPIEVIDSNLRFQGVIIKKFKKYASLSLVSEEGKRFRANGEYVVFNRLINPFPGIDPVLSDKEIEERTFGSIKVGYFALTDGGGFFEVKKILKGSFTCLIDGEDEIKLERSEVIGCFNGFSVVLFDTPLCKKFISGYPMDGLFHTEFNTESINPFAPETIELITDHLRFSAMEAAG